VPSPSSWGMSAAESATLREIGPPPATVARALGVTGQNAADLERYGALLVAANESMNLVGAATLGDFWRRHVLDCGQLLKLVPRGRRWADLGSGAGLPGLVLAILLKGVPGAKVDLVESVAKRAGFLRRVVAELDLPAQVHGVRAETLGITVDIVTARACAPLGRLFGYAEEFFRLGARGLFLKGESAAREIAEARTTWRFDCEALPSLSDPRGRILLVTGLSRAAHLGMLSA